MAVLATQYATGAAATTPGGGTAPSDTLGKNEFLQLLVAQLRNQDPLRPMEDREFIAQLAQLTTMETLQNMQSTLESLLGAQLLGHAMGLLGHEVTAIQGTGEIVRGTVVGVRREGADILIDLGETSVYLADIQGMHAAPANAAPDPAPEEPGDESSGDATNAAATGQ